MSSKVSIGFFKSPQKITHKYSFDLSWSNFWIARNEDQDISLLGADLAQKGIFINRTKNKTLKDVVTGLINDAREVIVISSFLLFEDDLANKLIEAARRGVRFYILSSPEQTIDKEEDYIEDNPNSIKNKTKHFYKKINRLIFLRTAEYFHAKFLVIDPFTPNAKGIMTTANFNKALDDKIELGVLLNKEQVKGAYNFFVYGFWLKAERELVETGDLHPINKDKISLSIKNLVPEKIKGVFLTLPKNKSGKKDITYDSIENKLLELLSINDIEKIYVSSFGYEENQFYNKLKEISKNAKAVVFAPRRESQFEILSKLKNATSNVQILAHPLLHAKFVVLKTKNSKYYGLVTTANFQQKGLKEGFEIGVALSNTQARELFDYCKIWEQKFPLELSMKNSIKNNLQKLPPEFQILVKNNNQRFRTYKIRKFYKESADNKLTSLDEEIKFPDKTTLLNKFKNRSFIPLSFEYSYNVIPPIVTKSEIKIDQEKSKEKQITIFQSSKKSGAYILGVKNQKEYVIAKKLKKEEKKFKNAKIVVID